MMLCDVGTQMRAGTSGEECGGVDVVWLQCDAKGVAGRRRAEEASGRGGGGTSMEGREGRDELGHNGVVSLDTQNSTVHHHRPLVAAGGGCL